MASFFYHMNKCVSQNKHNEMASIKKYNSSYVNLQTPNVNYSWRTAPLTSKIAFYIFIQKIQLPNILNMVYTLRFFLFKMQFVS